MNCQRHFFTCLIKNLTFCLSKRDPNAEDKMNPFVEQEAWEEHQIGKYFYIIFYLYYYTSGF